MNSLEKDDSLKKERFYKILESLYTSISEKDYEPDRSWIKPTYGKLYLDNLYFEIKKKFKCRPLVILNMCESAQITPSLQSESFIHFFLSRGAKAVIGTECAMTVEFAHPFAEIFLEDILHGHQAGVALLKTRRHFMREKKNPLGLAYTLFGSAGASFQPPSIKV